MGRVLRGTALPSEVVSNILGRLDAADVARGKSVCARWRAAGRRVKALRFTEETFPEGMAPEQALTIMTNMIMQVRREAECGWIYPRPLNMTVWKSYLETLVKYRLTGCIAACFLWPAVLVGCPHSSQMTIPTCLFLTTAFLISSSSFISIWVPSFLSCPSPPMLRLLLPSAFPQSREFS